jgi:hypothetical protein
MRTRVRTTKRSANSISSQTVLLSVPNRTAEIAKTGISGKTETAFRSEKDSPPIKKPKEMKTK